MTRATLLRWPATAGRLVFQALIAVGCFAAGVLPPESTIRDDEFEDDDFEDDEFARALWAQLPELRQLLPLLDGRR